MSRGKSQYLTNAGLVEASPIWLIQLTGIEERADPATTHDYYFTDAPEIISFFDDSGSPEAYLPMAMSVSPVEIDTSQKMVSFRLTFDNISRQMAMLAGTVKLSSGRCIVSRAFLEDLSDPAFAQTVFRGSIRSWTIGEQNLELEIGSDIPLINKAPRRLFSVRCQWRFKDTSCKYTGIYVDGFTEKWWNKTSSTYTVIDETIIPDLERVTQTINYTNVNPAGQSDYYNGVIRAVVVPLYSETYTFYVAVDDGVLLYVDGILLLDKWVNGSFTYTATKSLTAGKPTTIEIRHYENTGTQTLKLEWSSTSQAKEVIGTTEDTFAASLTPVTTCDKTIDTCKSLANQMNFGGFPHIPQSRDPRVAWTKV